MKLETVIIAAAMLLSAGVFAETNAVVAPALVGQNDHLYRRKYLLEKPENLRRVKGLDATKPVPQLFLDYLKQNGIELKAPKYIRFRQSDKGSAVEVRGTLADLDRVGILLVKLRDGP